MFRIALVVFSWSYVSREPVVVDDCGVCVKTNVFVPLGEYDF